MRSCRLASANLVRNAICVRGIMRVLGKGLTFGSVRFICSPGVIPKAQRHKTQYAASARTATCDQPRAAVACPPVKLTITSVIQENAMSTRGLRGPYLLVGGDRPVASVRLNQQPARQRPIWHPGPAALLTAVRSSRSTYWTNSTATQVRGSCLQCPECSASSRALPRANGVRVQHTCSPPTVTTVQLNAIARLYRGMVFACLRLRFCHYAHAVVLRPAVHVC